VVVLRAEAAARVDPETVPRCDADWGHTGLTQRQFRRRAAEAASQQDKAATRVDPATVRRWRRRPGATWPRDARV
jgi:hypothetical protein